MSGDDASKKSLILLFLFANLDGLCVVGCHFVCLFDLSSVFMEKVGCFGLDIHTVSEWLEAAVAKIPRAILVESC